MHYWSYFLVKVKVTEPKDEQILLLPECTIHSNLCIFDDQTQRPTCIITDAAITCLRIPVCMKVLPI